MQRRAERDGSGRKPLPLGVERPRGPRDQGGRGRAVVLMRFGDGAFPGQDAVVSGMSRAFVTSHSVAGTPPAFSPEDVAEHEDRIGRLRALMDEHGFDAVIANDVGAPGAYPAYARYLSNFTIGRPGH